MPDLGQFEIKRVDFVRAEIANEKHRAIGGDAAPSEYRKGDVFVEVRQVRHQIGGCLSYLNPSEGGVLTERRVVVEVFSIG